MVTNTVSRVLTVTFEKGRYIKNLGLTQYVRSIIKTKLGLKKKKNLEENGSSFAKETK